MTDTTQTLSEADLEVARKAVQEVAPMSTLRKMIDLQEGQIKRLIADVERLTYMVDNMASIKTKWNYFRDPYKEASK